MWSLLIFTNVVAVSDRSKEELSDDARCRCDFFSPRRKNEKSNEGLRFFFSGVARTVGRAVTEGVADTGIVGGSSGSGRVFLLNREPASSFCFRGYDDDMGDGSGVSASLAELPNNGSCGISLSSC